MNDYLYHHNANTHWAYPTRQQTDRLIDDARQAFADFLTPVRTRSSSGRT